MLKSAKIKEGKMTIDMMVQALLYGNTTVAGIAIIAFSVLIIIWLKEKICH